MKKIKTFGISLLVAACAACLSLAFVACKGGDKNANSYGAGEEGFYYYDGANSARYMLSLQSGNYMITANNETQYSGSYSYNEETGEISFSGDTAFTAKMGENALSLDMGDSGYSFKAYKYFDVTYVDENGKVVATESVLNGQSAEAITVDKDGYWFVGWFEDESNSSEFAFNTSIAGDTTVYGWYIEKNLQASEYEITLDYGDGTTETVSTMNGAVWTLPSDGILGWWVSATNKSGELTYKYTAGDVFTSDTTLFAVYDGIGASVTSEGITWVSAGANVSVTIYDADGTVAVEQSSTSSSNSSYSPSGFSSLPTGTYTVEVTSGSTTEYLTYVVNGLTRVSLSDSSVVLNGEGRVLSFAPVENATSYEITVSDGQKTVTENLGSRTYYNFSDWEMTKDGITFTVTAYADGYVSSVSNAYNYLLALGKVSVDMDGENVVWSRVDDALEYKVVIYGEDDAVIESFYTSDTSYSLKYYDAGTYTITVQPVTNGYYSETTTYSGYAKSTLASPVITSITNYSVSWSEVAGAVSYIVSVNGNEYSVETGTTLYFTDTDVNIDTNLDSYEIAVKAVETDGNDSSYSNAVVATNGAFSSAVSYGRNTVFWNYDISATSYEISVNGGAKTYVVDGMNSQEIELTKVGDNDITVTAYSGSDPIGQASLSVYAYSVTLDGNGLTTEKDVVYVAQGDTLRLGNVSGEILEHADFIGWYTQADFTEGQSDAYEGRGSEVLDGSSFTGNRNTYLYAYYSYEYVDVKLVSSMGYMLDENGDEVESMTVRIKYNSKSFTLPTPTPYGAEDNFDGWNTDSYGAGTKYTDQYGEANGKEFGGESTLYAYFRSVLRYDRTTYGGETVYSVSAGSEIGQMSDVTIPESYNGYGLILKDNAFLDCNSLQKLNIPDTIRYIAVVNNGYDSGTGAFARCINLAEVNVYATGEEADPQKEVLYYSEGGLLFEKISDTAVELLYYPQGNKATTASIPSTVSNEFECDAFYNPVSYKVTTLPTRVFKDKAFTEIVIPVTVGEIASYAFYGNTGLTKITFAEIGDGDTSLAAASLEIADYAFYRCSSLTEITLPSRYTAFNAQMFSGCTNLTKVNFAEGNTDYKSEDGIVLSADGTTLVYYPLGLSGEINTSTVVSSSSVVKIGASAFVDNTKITKVTISSTIVSIGENAFSGCVGIKDLVFEGTENSNDLTIESKAFYGCSSLTSVTLPKNLTTLKANAFAGCVGISYVYFDARPVTAGGEPGTLDFASGAFGSVSYITTLELGPNVPEIDFVGIFGGAYLEKVIVAEGNENYSSDETYGAVYNKERTKLLFYPAGRVGEFTLWDSATSLSDGVFSGNVNLTAVTFGASITGLSQSTFSGCTYLTAINIKESADGTEGEYISRDGVLYQKNTDGTLTLMFCPARCAVTSLTLQSDVSTVALGAFSVNVTVTEVDLTACANFTLTGSSTSGSFYGATALKTVTLPEGLTSIPTNAFNGCTALLGNLSVGGTMSIPESVTTIGEKAFYNCQNFAVKIPAGVTSIGANAFYHCWYTETAKAPIVFESVQTSEGEEPENLHAVTYTAAQSLTVGNSAFDYCRYATGLVIPKNMVSAGTLAFEYFGYSISSGTDTPITFEEGCQLTELGEKIFYYAWRVQNFEIPSSVTTIGTYAMSYMQALTSLEIPATVESVGTYAFYYDTKLQSVEFGEDCALTVINDYAFRNCTALEKVEIPSAVTAINQYAFYSCTALSEVAFGEDSGLTTIGNQAFRLDTALKSITLPASLTTLNEYAFAGSGLEEIDLSSTSVTSVGVRAFNGCKQLTTVKFPSTIETINERAFYNCYGLTEIDFGEEISSLKSVGTYAFSGCTSLKEFSFPETTAESIELGDAIFGEFEEESEDEWDEETEEPIRYLVQTPIETVYLSAGVVDLGGALKLCRTLTSITVSPDNPSYETDEENKILFDKSRGEILYIFGDVDNLVIPESVTTIGDYALQRLTSMTSVTIPETVTSIGSYAFYKCTSLTSVTIPETVTSIGSYAFCKCTSLTSATFEEGCSCSIGSNTFQDCSALKTITLSSGITSLPERFVYNCGSFATLNGAEHVVTLGDYTFAYTGVVSLDLPAVTSVGANAFSYCENLVSVTFGAGNISFGNYTFRNCSALEMVTLPEGVTSISDQMFYYCTSITSFTVPSTVTTIGSSAFYGCESLREVVLNDSITSIPSGLFQNCTSLETCVLPKYCSSIGSNAFYSCTSLKSLDVPSTCTSFGQNVFAYSGITSFEIPNGTTKLDNYIFWHAESLENVTMPDSVTTINLGAFYGCSALTSIVLSPNVTSLPQNAFYQCYSLEEIQFGNKITSIGASAFYQCTSLESIEFGASLTSIGYSCFSGCTSLKSVTLENGLTTINYKAFEDCTALEYILIPASVSSVAYQAFLNCDCTIYIRNTPNYVSTNWTSGYDKSSTSAWDNGHNGEVYYYSSTEPAFNADGTGYDGNFWHYDDNNEMAVWTFEDAYTIYTASEGDYVVYKEATDAIMCICFVSTETVEGVGGDDPVTVTYVTLCTAESCTAETEGTGYTVTLESGDSYTVVLDETSMAATITKTE